MRDFYFAMIVASFCACNSHIKYLEEISEAPIQNGLKMVISSPKQIYQNEFFSTERIKVEVTNSSNDTIFFENIFVFEEDHPVWGNFSFHISDPTGNVYPRGAVFTHYYEMLKRDTEYVILPPEASYQDSVSISLEADYSLRKNTTYKIYAQYINKRQQTTNAFPTQLPADKKLWTGVLRSNIYRFRL